MVAPDISILNRATRVEAALKRLQSKIVGMQQRINESRKRSTIWMNVWYMIEGGSPEARRLDRYLGVVRRSLDGIERFYDVVGLNLEEANAVLERVEKNARWLTQEVETIERSLAVPKPAPQTPAVQEVKETPQVQEEEKPQVLLQRPALEIALASRNDHHGEDSFREVRNQSGDLKGLVICDGITNANGRLASNVVCEVIQREFLGINATSDIKALRSQLDLMLTRTTRHLREEATRRGTEETATTMLLAFSDGHSNYVYYIGDGTVRQFSEDAYSIGDYLMTYERGGALGGYISSSGMYSSPTFLWVDCRVTEGSFLVVATDGAELFDLNNHLRLAKSLREDYAEGRKPLQLVLEQYLDGIENRHDDATIGVIWVT